MDTVMIVEDEKLIRQGIKSMILRSGVSVNTIIECSNGQMALDVLKKQRVDVMFTDIRMPKMDGITLVKEMQKLGLNTITVAISGYDEFDYAVEMMRNKAREYIVKPIDRQQISNLMVKFEKEVNKNKDNNEEIKKIYLQQLKYMMINDNMSVDEIGVLAKRFENIFFKDEYVAICCKYTDELKNSSYVYLKDVSGNDIIIIKKDDKEKLLKEELSNCYIGVSCKHTGLIEVKKAYEQACMMRKQAFATCRKVVEMKVNECELNDTPLKENLLEHAVQKVGTDKVSDTVLAIRQFARQVKLGNYSFETFEKQINLFLVTVKHTYKSVVSSNENYTVSIESIKNYQNIDIYIETIIKWIYETNAIITEKFDDYKNKQKIQTALSFINENYNKDLNMAVVSNYINMNYSLFSYTFKQYTGMNFVNYLKTKRIEEAKHLLEETELHVIEISQEVGYENEKHFMKIFKSVCGVSPTEYRKNVSFKKK